MGQRIVFTDLISFLENQILLRQILRNMKRKRPYDEHASNVATKKEHVLWDEEEELLNCYLKVKKGNSDLFS